MKFFFVPFFLFFALSIFSQNEKSAKNLEFKNFSENLKIEKFAKKTKVKKSSENPAESLVENLSENPIENSNDKKSNDVDENLNENSQIENFTENSESEKSENPIEKSKTEENEKSAESAKPESLNKNSEIQKAEKNSENKNSQNIEKENFFFTDSKNKLRRFSSDGEEFFVFESNEKNVLATSFENRFKRDFFDKNFRIIKKEVWNSGNDSKSAKLKSVKNYFYEGDKKNPISSEEFFLKDFAGALFSKIQDSDYEKSVQIFYDENSRIAEKSSYIWKKVENPEKNLEKNEKPKEKIEKILQQTEKFSYDEEGRFLTFEKTIFVEPETKNEKTKNPQKMQSEKFFYDYNGVGNFPDEKFFENGTLRSEKIYFDAESYTQKIYFENGLCIQNEFVNGIKTSEIVTSGGQEIRRREF